MKATSNKAWTIFSAPSRQIWVWGQNKIAFFSGNCFFRLGVWLALFRVHLQIVGQHYLNNGRFMIDQCFCMLLLIKSMS